MNNFTKYSALVTTILLSVSLTVAGPAQAAEPANPILSNEKSSTTEVKYIAPAIVSSATVKMNFPTPTVTSKPAPVVIVAPAPVVQQAKVQTVAPAIVPGAQAPAAIQVKPVPVAPAPVVAAPQAVAPAPVALSAPSGVGAALAASAMGQIGIAQDCTRMVENALGSIGIRTGDIGPINFFQYGRVVGDPQPGDLMIQGNAHVAIYVGNGQAVSGGFNGQNTVLHPASYLGGASYVRVG